MPLGDFSHVYVPGEEMPSNRGVMTNEAMPIREAGVRFSYSNVGYNILEILIEDVTGQSYSEYLRSEVLLPLGMESATFEVDAATKPYPPTGYNLGGEAVSVISIHQRLQADCLLQHMMLRLCGSVYKRESCS